MVPSKLLLLLTEDEPRKHAPMRFMVGGCCPCGVMLIESIYVGGGTSSTTDSQYEIYLNDVLLGTFAVPSFTPPTFNQQSWIHFSTQPNFPLVTPEDDWSFFHYDEANVSQLQIRQFGAPFDPALLVSGQNSLRIKSIAGSAVYTARIFIGAVTFNDNYPLPADNPSNVYFDTYLPDPEYAIFADQDLTPPYDNTFVFTKP